MDGHMRAWSVGLMALLSLAGAPPAGGQQTAVGEVAGVVRDEEGAPVGRAEVFIASAGRRVLTDAEGRFVLRAVPAGRQVVQASLLGYAPVRREVVVGE